MAKVLLLGSLLIGFLMPRGARADDFWDREQRPLRIATLLVQTAGAGLLLSAGALEAKLIAQADNPGSSYHHQQNLIGPLAGVGSVITIGGIPMGAAAWENEGPDALYITSTLLGVGAMVGGVALWASHAEPIGDTQLRQPVHAGGSVLFSAGLPLAIWGGTWLFGKALGRAYHN